PVSFILGDHGNFRERFDRVNAARAHENEASAVTLRHFEQVHRGIKIVLDKLPAARRAIDAGEDTWVRGRVYDPVDGRKTFEVAGGPDIAVSDFHSALL